jgi:hypothetical protein
MDPYHSRMEKGFMVLGLLPENQDLYMASGREHNSIMGYPSMKRFHWFELLHSQQEGM